MAGTCEDLTIEETWPWPSAGARSGAWAGRSKNRQREVFRERLATLGLGLENRLSDRIGLLSAASARP